VVRKTDPKDQAEVLEWLEWAERQADRIDPLKPSPRSLVDDQEKVIRSREQASPPRIATMRLLISAFASNLSRPLESNSQTGETRK
jgi:hypothetical protein